MQRDNGFGGKFREHIGRSPLNSMSYYTTTRLFQPLLRRLGPPLWWAVRV
jgi:hypothetical protein